MMGLEQEQEQEQELELELELELGQVWWGDCTPLLAPALSQPSLLTTHPPGCRKKYPGVEVLGAVICSVVLLKGPPYE